MNRESTNLRVAIVGSGPSGFFAAEEILSSNSEAIIDMFDRLPTPYGLVRGGVAPDHQKIKSVVAAFSRTAAKERFRFFGNIEIGRDFSAAELKQNYSAVIFATGAKSDRHMKIPGEDLSGSFAATEFVGWYNAHPDYRDLQFNLNCERVVVVGNGNVAMDVTRMLARDPKELSKTDMDTIAVAALAKSQIKEIVVLGRRGPLQASFTPPELREFMHLENVDVQILPEESTLDPLSQEDFDGAHTTANHKTVVELVKEIAARPLTGAPRRVTFRFLYSPVEILGENGRVSAVKIEKNILQREADGSLRPYGSGQTEVLSAGLILRSVGYYGLAIEGLPYDSKKGILPNQSGRIFDATLNKILPGYYVVGWAKRGPSGVIGTNKPDAIETAKNLLADWQAGALPRSGSQDAAVLIQQKKLRATSWADWQKLDALEIANGKAKGKVRDKFDTLGAMLKALEE